MAGWPQAAIDFIGRDVVKPFAGKISATPVELFDAGPTLADFAGARISYDQFARSLADVVQNPNIEHRDFALSELKQELMYLDRDWKLMLNRKGEPYRLFNVKDDPQEMEDLLGRKKHEDLVAELKQKLLDRRVKTSKA